MNPVSQLAPILCYLAAGILGAIGQYFYKMGASSLGQVALLKNYNLFIGAAAFCGVMVLFVLGFKWGGRLSVVYPFYATTFIWGALIAHYFEKEHISTMMIAGILLICVGVAFVGAGAKQG
ncbi:hypothetical protein GW916_00680 [bacterium]|nr:hypothetical protein [bacterium]